jgi:voltage-gated potassium channel
VGDRFSARRLRTALVAVSLVFAAGTLGFHAWDDESWLNAFYRAVVTSSLTGIDTRPQGTGAILLTILLVLAGVTIFAYVAAAIVEAIARGVVSDVVADRRRRRMIDQLSEHFIICGYGRVGQRIGREFEAAGVGFVVLDFSDIALGAAEERSVPFIAGNGTSDGDLVAAGIDRARGVIASSDSDVDNLYITLSARARRQDLMIVARASTEEAEHKLRLAGADRVIQPYSTAGMEMAKLALKPQVAAFLDIVSTHGGPEMRFEEIVVTGACGHSGKSIRDLRIRHVTGALVVGVQKPDGTFDTTPDPDSVLGEGDVLIAVGTEKELRALEELFAPREAVAG